MDNQETQQPEGSNLSFQSGLDSQPPQPHPGILRRFFFNPGGLRSGWRLLIFAAILFICISVLAVLARSIARIRAAQITPHGMLVFEGLSFASVLIASAIMGAMEKKSFGDYLLPWRSAFKGKFWFGALWGWAALTALLLAIRVDHGFFFGHVVLAKSRIPPDAALWALAFLLTGFFEEFTFRGYALFTLTKGVGFWPAAAVLSFVFGATHLGNPGEDWAGALCAGLIGLFFCFTVRRTGNLWFAIGLHAMWDYSETFLYSVPNSGLLAKGHLLDSSLQGPRWLTGGSVGPEGSLFVFVLIGILFLVFQLLYPKARFPAQAGR